MRRWLVCLFLAGGAFAQAPNAGPELRVALAGSAPFVVHEKDGVPAGFAVGLWESVAAANGWRFTYRDFSTTEAALAAVAAGHCDVLVGNTSITSERERQVEFSQPFYRAGLQVMVSEPRGQLLRMLGGLAEPQHMIVLGVIALGVLIATVAVEAFERRHNPDFPATRPAGLAESFYYIMGLVTGKSAYKGFPGPLGRLVLVGWMVASLFVVSYVTSMLTTAMTVDTLRGHIHGPDDLANHTIGLIGGSESENYARRRNLDYVAYPTMAEAVADLVKGRVPCVLGDSPVLQYYDYTNPRLSIHEVGPVFQAVNYGFAVPIDSALREPINLALLHMAENGDFDPLGRAYFGESYQK